MDSPIAQGFILTNGFVLCMIVMDHPPGMKTR